MLTELQIELILVLVVFGIICPISCYLKGQCYKEEMKLRAQAEAAIIQIEALKEQGSRYETTKAAFKNKTKTYQR